MARINLVELAQHKIRQHLQKGATVVDASVGNGYDTLMLAEAVGEQGMVYGFDLQQKALKTTRERLCESGVLGRVELIEGSHADMERLIPVHEHSKIDLVMFNLGYLPGGDKEIITQSESTIKALNAARSILSDHGAVSVIAYPGHAGGDIECERVSVWFDGLEMDEYQVEKVIPEIAKKTPPQWYWVQRLKK